MEFFLAIFSPERVEVWIEAGGIFVLFGLLFACGLGLPLPEDIPLLLAGYMISQAKMHVLTAAIAAWLGIIGGDCVLYMLARKFGLEITRVRFIGKHLTKERILMAEDLLDRWGVWVVAVGRMFAGVRGAMVVAAGATRFNFTKFVIADGLAALVSGGLFIALGYWAGIKLGNIEQMRSKIKGVEHWVFLIAALIALVVALYFFWWRRRHTPITDVALTKVDKVAVARTGVSHLDDAPTIPASTRAVDAPRQPG
jgi:membrane protein DedA with SNARE-associated domain